MQLRSWISVGALAALVGGCAAKKVPPPAEQTVTLADQKASYRDWRRGKVCDADPNRLRDELDSMRVLLADFLGQTSAGFDGMWGDEHVALLKEAQVKLPPALDGTEAALKGLPACPNMDLSDLTPGVTELVRQAKKRLEEAPLLLPYVEARRALMTWKSEQEHARALAKSQNCPKKSKVPIVYFAMVDEADHAAYEFCDGAEAKKVGDSWAVAAPGKKIPEKSYLDAAQKFPPEQVARAPRLPPKSAEKPDDDKFDLNQEIK